MRGADREEPVLDRLRGVMRVGCSGLCEAGGRPSFCSSRESWLCNFFAREI